MEQVHEKRDFAPLEGIGGEEIVKQRDSGIMRMVLSLLLG